MKEQLSQTLRQTVADLIPGAPLGWSDLPESGGLRGFFLDQEAALRPLPADKVDLVMREPPFWTLLWPSGELLCRRLASHGQLVQGKTVLDFGCGCGLVAVAAKVAGAARVWAVDCDPLAILASRLTALENRVSVDVAENADQIDAVDLLLLADFLYDQTHMPLFYSLQARANEVLVVDSRLTELDLEGYSYLGTSLGHAVPDLDPHREFGRLRFWYRGSRGAEWKGFLGIPTPVAQGVHEC
jgi:predicted nicotinamide N-methyase